MNIPRSHIFREALLFALAGFAALPSLAAEGAPPATDAVTERIQQIIERIGGEHRWGADPAEKEIADRGMPIEATWMTGAGHSLIGIGSDGRPIGGHLWLNHVKVEGDLATATECVLGLGRDDHTSCPPAPLSVVDCTTWSVPAESAKAALLAARAALFTRVYEKKYRPGPREESLDEGWASGVVGGVDGGTTSDFLAVAQIVEAGEHPKRVSEEWAGYASAGEVGRYARADAATDILNEAFDPPKDARPSSPPSAIHAEFSRLFETLPLDGWWWVNERMILMAGALGTPADLPRIKKYLTDRGRLRDYALEALARRTGRDTRCLAFDRRQPADAAASWQE